MNSNKLYPPYIESTLPAFTGTNLKVPYILNRGVNYNNIASYSLLIKKVTTNQIIDTIIGDKDIENLNYIATFDLSNQNLVKGQYYKIQLAFKDVEGVVGYYSTSSIVRYIDSPEVEIINFDTESMRVQGKYNPSNSGEYLYSTRFYLKNQENTIIEDSGEIIYNQSNIDDNNNSIVEYKFKSLPVFGQKYKAFFEIKTGNNYTQLVDSGEDYILAMPSVRPSAAMKLVAKNNYSEGYIEVAIQPLLNDEMPITGAFILGRSSSKDNFNSYEELIKFELVQEQPNKIIFKDLLVDHNLDYKYAFQQYNNNHIISKKIWSNLETAKFEDMFLTDGDRQFKIKYNPRVSSIKSTIQETKIDTLGGQYPFIFRNGSTNYKELPLSGLISYHTDEAEMFLEKPQGFIPNFNLTDDNIELERQFKLEAMEWLNNGEVKYFKSPIEGGMLVRLMNISLTPNDTLGRMLHTFNATAYEIGELNYSNLSKYGFINAEKIIKSNNLIVIEQKELLALEEFTLDNVISLEFIVNRNHEESTELTLNGDNKIIIPTSIKSYLIEVPMSQVTIQADHDCLLIYHTKNNISVFDNNIPFNQIYNYTTNEQLKIQQFGWSEEDSDEINLDILKALETDSNTEVAFFAYLQFYKNPDRNEGYKIYLNDEIIDLTKTNNYLLRNIDYITSLKIEKGVILECGYYLNILES